MLALLAFVGAGGLTATGFTAAGFAGSFFDSTLRAATLLVDALDLPALTGAAGLLTLLAAADFFGVRTFLLTTLAFDFAGTGGLALIVGLGGAFLTDLAATFGFATALAVGFARATTLLDLAMDLDFCVDFAISVLTPS